MTYVDSKSTHHQKTNSGRNFVLQNVHKSQELDHRRGTHNIRPSAVYNNIVKDER